MRNVMLHQALRRIEVAALAAMLGALFMTGAAAAIAFPTVRDLEPSLPQYAAYPSDHWLLTAGVVMARVFTVYDITQLLCVAIAGIAFVASLRGVGGRVTTIARGIVLAALLLSILQYTFMLRAEMDSHLLMFLHAAEQGDVATADSARGQFDALHPAASTRLSIHGALALAALALALVARPPGGAARPVATAGAPA